MSIGIGATPTTSGLVFEYDMANTQKSFKGQPTVNYVPNADTMAGWGNYSNGTPVQFMTEFGTIGYSMNNLGSWNGVARGVTIPATGTYTFSAWIRWMGGSPNVTGGSTYVSGWGGGDNASYPDKTKVGVWQRVSITLNCITTSMTFYLICFGGTNNADNSTWQVTMPQIEAGSVATPFVLGTRSTTTNLVDLTGNSVPTATSLVYNSDNTFSFNGSSSYISTNYTAPLNDFTVCVWFNASGNTGGYDRIIDKLYTTGTMLMRNSTSANSWGGGVMEGSPPYGIFLTLTDGQWHYLVSVRQNTTHTLYGDGITNTVSNTVSSAPLNTNQFAIGSWYNNQGQSFQGNVPIVQIYNRALSASEILQNFSAQRGRFGI